MDEHAFGKGVGIRLVRKVERALGGYGDLEASHVPWVSGVFEAVLIALEEEFELVPETN